jgi:vacuolar-type H+-ATPase subunit I/STV1
MVYFPRYDEKGNEILEGTNTIRLMINDGISAQTLGKTVEFFWDTNKDTAVDFSQSQAMQRLEADRLIKRLGNLNEQKSKLEEELAEINAEIQKVQERLDELQQ